MLYPVLPDLDAFEQKTNRLLEGRRRAGGFYKPQAGGIVKPFGMDLPFLSLLFAVLASGCQLSGISLSDRELTSWVYGTLSLTWSEWRDFDAQHSILCIPMLANVKLCVTADSGGHPDSARHQQCIVI